MSWIKLREDLSTDPSVALIASRCSVTACHAVGALACAWSWAGRLSEDGKVPLATPELLDRVTQTKGFSRAMEAAGWLEIGDTYLLFPKWDRHNSDDAKKRALQAERVRRHRETLEHAEAVTHERYQRRREERRKKEPPRSPPPGGASSGEEKIKPGKKASKPVWCGELPAALQSPRFQEVWARWILFRSAELRKPVTQLSGDQSLRELSGWGLERAVRAIEHTIARGWQGIREPEPARNGHASASEYLAEQSNLKTLKELGLA